jgi:hypothetical protein
MHKVLSIIALAYDILKKGYFTTIILHRLSNRRTDSYQYSLDLATSLRNEAAVANTEPNQVNKPPTSECGDSQVQEIEIPPSSPILEPNSIGLSPDPDLNSTHHTATSISQSSGSTPVASETRPTLSPQNSNRPHSEPSADSEISRNDLPSFADLYDADCYLDDIVGSYDQKQTRRWQLNLFQNKVRIFVPNLRNFIDSLGALAREVYGIILKGHKLNIPVTISSLTYIVSVKGYAYDAYIPFLVAILKHPFYSTRPRRPLHIMKRIRLSRLPQKAPKEAWVPWAITTFIICIGQVLAVELVLRWNYVKGVQAFGTVGQLVPFVLGVGGLSKVLWTKSKLLWEGRRPEKRRDEVDEGGVDELADAYFARKERYETHVEIVEDSVAKPMAQDA